jgi:PAS domain S-box-containing protein
VGTKIELDAEIVRQAFTGGAVSEMDRRGRITYVNDALVEMSLCSRKDLLGKCDDVIILTGQGCGMTALINRLVTSGKIFTGVMKEKISTGDYRWVDATIVPIKNNHGNIVKYVHARYAIADDVMGEYLYRKQLKKLMAES